METAGRLDQGGAGAQREVIGVGEDQLGTELAHLLGEHALDGRGRADRREAGVSKLPWGLV
jgi:hypothetical protein